MQDARWHDARHIEDQGGRLPLPSDELGRAPRRVAETVRGETTVVQFDPLTSRHDRYQMLHIRRKRLEQLAEAEAAGDSFWTEVFDAPSRARISHAYDAICGGTHLDVCSREARKLILAEAGLMFLDSPDSVNDYLDFRRFMLSAPDEMMPSVIEAIAIAMERHRERFPGLQRFSYFPEVVNTILREHRISFELVNNQMVEFSSLELHESVVSPVVRLLADGSRFMPVEAAYQQALVQLSDGNPANAITDAGTALQQLLIAKGCEGNALGPLITSARKNGLLLSHDSPLTVSILKAMDWVSSDRSQLGDSHNATQPSLDDAWLIVHIVGALVLRLAKEPAREGVSG